MKRSLLSLLTATILTAAAFTPLVAHADDKPLSKEDVEAIVKKVIAENPELIMKAVSEYQESQAALRITKAAQNMVKLKDKIAHDPRSPSIGNPNGDVTVVEFFDYHCGYCKRFYPEMAQLLREDKHVRIVFKEFPILSPDSTNAAKAALAVYNIDKGKYFDYHIKLMQSNGEFSEEMLTRTAQDLGIDESEFKKAYGDPALESDLAHNKVLAKDLDISGTPGIIVGTELLPGAVPYDKLKATVAEVRDNQNQHKSTESKDD